MSAPLLVLHGTQIVVSETGEVVPPEDPEAVPASVRDLAQALARARMRAEVLGLRASDLRAPHLDAYDAALRADAEYREVEEALAQARAEADRLHGMLDECFADRRARVSVDAGAARITWPKPRETWAMARPVSWLVTPEASMRARQAILAAATASGVELAPGTADQLWAGILDGVLQPGSTTAPPGPPTVTIRGEGV